MRSTTVENAQARQAAVVCYSLIVVELLLLLPVLLRWADGVAPVYPGQYRSRLFSAVSGVAIMGALLVTLSHYYRTLRGRILSWLLLGLAALALAMQVIYD